MVAHTNVRARQIEPPPAPQGMPQDFGKNASSLSESPNQGSKNMGGSKKVCAREGSFKPLSETPPALQGLGDGAPPPPPRNPPPNGGGIYVRSILATSHGTQKGGDVAPHQGLPLAQTTRTQMSMMIHQRNQNQKCRQSLNHCLTQSWS